MTPQVAYYPQFFDAPDLQTAKQIILTPEFGLGTEDRWQRETDYLANLIASVGPKLGPTSVVLDYGCGVGRLSKALMDRYDCAVVGADISPQMRAYATEYVSHHKFFSLDPSALTMLRPGFADLVISVWVLQHCHRPIGDLRAIREALRRDTGRFFVVNETQRLVPAVTEDGPCWITDGLKMHGLLQQQFDQCASGMLDPAIVTETVSQRTFWGLYR